MQYWIERILLTIKLCDWSKGLVWGYVDEVLQVTLAHFDYMIFDNHPRFHCWQSRYHRIHILVRLLLSGMRPTMPAAIAMTSECASWKKKRESVETREDRLLHEIRQLCSSTQSYARQQKVIEAQCWHVQTWARSPSFIYTLSSTIPSVQIYQLWALLGVP